MKYTYNKLITDKMNSKLIKYIEDKIFPIYNENKEGHGINHIDTVIRKSL